METGRRPELGVCAAVDVHYLRTGGARAAAVESGADAEEVAEATLQLRRELLDLDVEAVEILVQGSRRRDPGEWT